MTDVDIDEVFTECPACGREIPFYQTVDRDNQCPECGTDKDELFEIGCSQPIEPAEPEKSKLALTDGGRDE